MVLLEPRHWPSISDSSFQRFEDFLGWDGNLCCFTKEQKCFSIGLQRFSVFLVALLGLVVLISWKEWIWKCSLLCSLCLCIGLGKRMVLVVSAVLLATCDARASVHGFQPQATLSSPPHQQPLYKLFCPTFLLLSPTKCFPFFLQFQSYTLLFLAPSQLTPPLSTIWSALPSDSEASLLPWCSLPSLFLTLDLCIISLMDCSLWE